uniref:AlNc14C18G1924 protein n=1 Tax=Albugo laibachii Nc14 TaxID=890382 RepID=F0W4V4_9STRA|nr:AlNc14C18G1924 [Albugo laibachii Nc14]|eukprot:CCA16142.1 AlNc14C18G1924 [Albugo laibachii Nc14]
MLLFIVGHYSGLCQYVLKLCFLHPQAERGVFHCHNDSKRHSWCEQLYHIKYTPGQIIRCSFFRLSPLPTLRFDHVTKFINTMAENARNSIWVIVFKGHI